MIVDENKLIEQINLLKADVEDILQRIDHIEKMFDTNRRDCPNCIYSYDDGICEFGRDSDNCQFFLPRGCLFCKKRKECGIDGKDLCENFDLDLEERAATLEAWWREEK